MLIVREVESALLHRVSFMPDQNHSPYDRGLDKNAANYMALSPISFLKRAALVYPDHTSVIHGDIRFTWAETFSRARCLAAALSAVGVTRGDTVSLMLPNVPAFVDASFGVLATGGVLNSLNTRLDSDMLAFIFDHANTKVLIVDTQFSAVIRDALGKCKAKPLVIDVEDTLTKAGERLSDLEYESFIAHGDPDFRWELPSDEWDAATLSYTSGTTGNPKGVVAHHRGLYLLAIGAAIASEMLQHPNYLWTLPMFHGNGWCYPYTLAMLAGTNICLRSIDCGAIYQAIEDHNVTFFCAAPTVLNMILNSDEFHRRSLPHTVRVMTGGAAPSSTILKRFEELGFDLIHVYGLTEVLGADTYCAWKPEWDLLTDEERMKKKIRQGVGYVTTEDTIVADPHSCEAVPRDGDTIGEVLKRGHSVMRGYLKNPEATEEAFAGGWFHTGDLAVWHQDGYIEVRDRSKDIIISGGENIPTIEIEDLIHSHPDVAEIAVVAKPDEHWGEVPCAFVTVKKGRDVSEQAIIDYCRSRIAHFKCPKRVVFSELPKTATGKIQKFRLRDLAKDL